MAGKALGVGLELNGSAKPTVSENGKECDRRGQTGHHRRLRRCHTSQAQQRTLRAHMRHRSNHHVSRPRGCLPSTISSSIEVPTPNGWGRENRRRVELTSRVTSVIGKFLGTPPVLRRRSADQCWRGGTPDVRDARQRRCVGTRTKRRGSVGTKSGASRRAGNARRIRKWLRSQHSVATSAAGLGGQDSNGTARFVALSSPRLRHFVVAGYGPTN